MTHRWAEANATTLSIGLLAAAALATHLAAATTLGFHRDELLYLSQAARPAFGYLSVPPLTAWVGAIWTTCFGESLLAVRALAAVYGLGYLLLVERHAVDFGGSNFARVLAASTAVVTPISLRVFGLYQPVGLDLVLWAAISLACLRYARAPTRATAAALGAVVGLALLNKYLVALWVGGLLIGIAITPLRSLITRATTAVAAGVALLVWSPNLLWQAAHAWPVITHFGALADSQLIYVSRVGILAEQVPMLLGAFPLALWGGHGLWRRSDTRFIPVAALVVAGALVVLRGKPYYLAGVYAPLLAAGSVALAARLRLRHVRGLVVGCLVLPSVALLPFGLPVARAAWLVGYFDALERHSGLAIGRTDEGGQTRALPQDFADMLGWAQLGRAVVAAVDTLTRRDGLPPESIVVYAENYGQAGAIDYAFRQNGLDRLPLSFHESWLLWSPTDLPDDVRAFVYINDELGEDVAAWFGHVSAAAVITEPHARERGTTVYVCQAPRQPVRELWRAARAGRDGF